MAAASKEVKNANKGMELPKKANTSESSSRNGYFTSSAARDKERYNSGTNHKSFDFSDSWINGREYTENSPEDWRYRKFHQTGIFVNGGGESTLITSNLPEHLTYSLTSKWETPLNFNNGLFNLGMQLLSHDKDKKGDNKSGITRASTFKIWAGTEPLTITLDIPIVDDGGDKTKTNMMEAIHELSKLVLPGITYGTDSFYTPPPSPLQLTVQWDKKYSLTHTDKRIMVQLGGILLMDNCVIEKVEVDYPNTKAQILHNYEDKDIGYSAETGKKFLHPLLANVKITISTIEALTIDNFAKMLWGRPQSGSGNLNIDLSGLRAAIKAAQDFVTGKPLNEIYANWKNKYKTP